jgi:hypothetical protein
VFVRGAVRRVVGAGLLEEREVCVFDCGHEQGPLDELIPLLARGLGDEHAGMAGGPLEPPLLTGLVRSVLRG